jgi:exosortase A
VSVSVVESVHRRLTSLQYALVIAMVVVALYMPTFISMAQTWSRDATFAHGWAIPLISLWLFWQRRERFASVPLAPSWAGFWCCLVLTLMWTLADLLAVQVVRQAAATALLPAALWGLLGTEFVRRAFFPLAYLAFAVPFGDVFVPLLMRFTTEFTVIAVRMVGVPIYQDGNLFSLPSGNFEVVKACSGVRYLIASVALGTLYAGISYRDWRRRAAFVALSIVVPIIANGLRAFGIVMIAHWSQMEYAVGIDHLIYGWLFFGLVMMLLFWIGSRFIEPAGAGSAPATSGSVQAGRFAWLAAVGVVVVVFSGADAVHRVRVRAAADPAWPGAVANLPLASERWRSPEPLSGGGWDPAFAQALGATRLRYDGAQGSVLLFARDYAGPVEADNALTSTALVEQEQGPWRAAAGPDVAVSSTARVRSARISSDAGAQLHVWIWYLVNGELAAGPIRAKWLQLRSWLKFQQPVSSIVAVAAQGSEAPSLLAAFLEQYPALLGTTTVPSER